MGSEELASGSIRSQRTRPAIPGATASTLPLDAQRPYMSVSKKIRRVTFLLLILGVLLEIIYLALYPLLLDITGTGSPSNQQQLQQVQQALPRVFPWLPSLYWTKAFPWLASLLAQVSWLNLLDSHSQNLAATLIATFLLLFAGLVVLLASQIARDVLPEQSSPVTLCFFITLLLAGLFGITMVLSPINLNIFSRDMLVYGLYGRMIAIHHANPYSVAPTAFPHDLLQMLLVVKATTSYGPVWLDTSLGITLISGESIVHMLLGFRLLGLVAHLANTILIWSITARLKPRMRLSLTVLYAWNPLILLFSIAYMHQEIVLVSIVLLAIFFFQRNSPTIGWTFVLLTALINLLWLPLLLLFFRYMFHESRILRPNQRFLWWMGMVLTSCIIMVLAYAPYWHTLGFNGLVVQLYHAFLPDSASNSLDASLLNLPIAAQLMWLLTPQHWSLLALGIMTLFFLLGILLADTLELVILFSCWLLLTLVFLQPIYWPWYALGPLILAICSTHQRTRLLALMLATGALLSFAFLLTTTWAGQALVAIGLPLVFWGWILFFTTTWQMTGARNEQEQRTERFQRQQREQGRRTSGLSRPPWATSASRPPRSRR